MVGRALCHRAHYHRGVCVGRRARVDPAAGERAGICGRTAAQRVGARGAGAALSARAPLPHGCSPPGPPSHPLFNPSMPVTKTAFQCQMWLTLYVYPNGEIHVRVGNELLNDL